MTRKEEILSMVKPVLIEKLQKSNPKVFIFGSQAGKKELIRADIDIGIYEGQKLNLDVLCQIKEALNDDLPTLYSFDVVDFCDVNDNFKKIAFKNLEWF